MSLQEYGVMGVVGVEEQGVILCNRLLSGCADAAVCRARRRVRHRVPAAVVIALAGGLGFAARGYADGVGAGIAHGQDADQYGVQVQFDRSAPLKEWSSSALRSYVLVGIGEFHGTKNGVPQHTIRVLGTTGVLRWEHVRIGGVRPFLDFGIGIGGLSETSINGNRDFGGRFEFNEIVQAGVRFDSRDQYEFNLRGQHFSNAGINPPNDGMTYGGAGFTWYWK
jgi:hypothetical protein